MTMLSCVVFILFIGTAISFSGTFIPKAFYVIDSHGQKSDLVHFRTKRESGFYPLLRLPRSGSSSSASAYSSASASSSSGSGPINFSNGYVPSFGEDGFGKDFDYGTPHLPEGATIFSRFGEEEGSGVRATGAAQGPKGAFSSTSVSADDSGKVKYAVKSGKY